MYKYMCIYNFGEKGRTFSNIYSVTFIFTYGHRVHFTMSEKEDSKVVFLESDILFATRNRAKFQKNSRTFVQNPERGRAICCIFFLVFVRLLRFLFICMYSVLWIFSCILRLLKAVFE